MFANMNRESSRFHTNHTDIINCTALNYHGTRLATCSSDQLIKIFEVKPNGQKVPVAEVSGHKGPVWKVAFSHPKFGELLASAGYDKRVVVWRETNGRYVQVFEYTGHEASVSCVAFGPKEYGLVLASVSADGSIAVHTLREDTQEWETARIIGAHEQGVNSVSWAPPIQLQAFQGVDTAAKSADDRLQRRFATCGNDRNVKIWLKGTSHDEWTLESTLKGHTDFVRDVAWNPRVFYDTWTIVSVSQDQSALLWRTKRSGGDSEWHPRTLLKAEGALDHVSWDTDGNTLAISSDDNTIIYFEENMKGDWVRGN